MKLTLPSPWIERWKTSKPFDHALALQGEIFREQPGRRTLKFKELDRYYFAKIHLGVGWKEILKNLFQFRLPILGAQNEVRAIEKLSHFNFTPTLIGYGWRGNNPATLESFVITRAVENTISLEDYCRDWKTHPPTLHEKRHLIKQVAHIAKIMHEKGVNHRDFYICHFLLNTTSQHLTVIDWHRAHTRAEVPFRWKVKDIAALLFSAMDLGLTKRDAWRFMRTYNKAYEPTFWRCVLKRAVKLYRKIHKRDPDYVPR